MIPRSGLRSTVVSSKTCCSSSASFQSGSILAQSSTTYARLRIGAVPVESAVLAHDLALLLFHARAAAFAMMHPVDASGLTVDRVIVHGRKSRTLRRGKSTFHRVVHRRHEPPGLRPLA